ncbi:MAG: AraC family transcriptional regulator [Clostridiales Family XIII bacterium]|jgi:AraC-like DNA-binding protein|nr:AraC family transcriptional regulator [Clostridiales Family XIII bacterium]
MIREDTLKSETIIERSNYYHDSNKSQRTFIETLLHGNTDLIDQLTPEMLGSYDLADEPLRSLKNSVIIMTSIICRESIKYGVADELCFSLSDYYIKRIESLWDMAGVVALTKEMLKEYARLVRKTSSHTYSLPILRSVQYINKHMYEPIQVKTVAEVVKLHPTYLSALFKKETGVRMTDYIREKKLERIHELLMDPDKTFAQIAEMLGYRDASHFSRDFKRQFLCTPRQFVQCESKK